MTEEERVAAMQLAWNALAKRSEEERQAPERQVFDANWLLHYNKLVVYKDTNGDVRVLQGNKLGKWVNNQRRRKDKLSDEKIALLDKLGFVWNVFDANWLDHYYELVAYKLTEGNVNVPHGNG